MGRPERARAVSPSPGQPVHYLYIDTGAMYRAFTWAVLEKGIDLSDEKAVRDLVDTIDIRLEPQADLCRVYVDRRK